MRRYRPNWQCERASSTGETRPPPKNAQYEHKAAKPKAGFKYKAAHSDKDEEPVHDHWEEEAELKETVLPRMALETMCDEGSDCNPQVTLYAQ